MSLVPVNTICGGALPAELPVCCGCDMICLGRKGGRSLKGEGPGACSSMGFYWIYLHRNTGHICKAHQSLSGSNDQIIDNIQRTLRAYFESGSDS